MQDFQKIINIQLKHVISIFGLYTIENIHN